MTFHGVDTKTVFRRMRELAPDAYRAWLAFDQKAFAPGALPGKTKELIALGIAHITQCPWCIDVHTKKAATAGCTDEEIGEVIFVAMAMASGAAWSHGGLAPHGPGGAPAGGRGPGPPGPSFPPRGAA